VFKELLLLIEKFSKNMLKKNKGSSVQVVVPVKVQKSIVKQYSFVKNNYANGLILNMQGFISNSITMDDYLASQKNLISSAFKDAFFLGKSFGLGVSSPLDDAERRFIVYQTTKEMNFMKNFANDIQNFSGKMPYTKRMKMYSDSLNSMFGFGRLVYLPEDVKIYWKLGVTDKHCLDCLMFTARNPYTKKTLPAFPKSGNSRCLSNCLCSLNYYYNNSLTSSDYENYILNVDNQKEGKDVPNEEQYNFYMEYKEEFYYNRLMYEMTKDKKYKELYEDIRKDFNRFTKNNNLYIPEGFPVRDILSEIRSFKKNVKFEFIDIGNRAVAGQLVSVFVGNAQKYGKVVGYLGEDLIVNFLDQTQVLINPSKNVIFKEN